MCADLFCFFFWGAIVAGRCKVFGAFYVCFVFSAVSSSFSLILVDWRSVLLCGSVILLCLSLLLSLYFSSRLSGFLSVSVPLFFLCTCLLLFESVILVSPLCSSLCLCFFSLRLLVMFALSSHVDDEGEHALEGPVGGP